jgi:hypothetical protein
MRTKSDIGLVKHAVDWGNLSQCYCRDSNCGEAADQSVREFLNELSLLARLFWLNCDPQVRTGAHNPLSKFQISALPYKGRKWGPDMQSPRYCGKSMLRSCLRHGTLSVSWVAVSRTDAVRLSELSTSSNNGRDNDSSYRGLPPNNRSGNHFQIQWLH